MEKRIGFAKIGPGGKKEKERIELILHSSDQHIFLANERKFLIVSVAIIIRNGIYALVEHEEATSIFGMSPMRKADSRKTDLFLNVYSGLCAQFACLVSLSVV